MRYGLLAVIQTGRGVPYMRQIIVEGHTLDVKDGTTYLELAKNFQKKFDHDIVLVLENNKMRELFRKVKDGATVTFLTTGQIDGYNTYRRSATLLLLKAIYDVEGMEAVRGMKVEFSVSEGYYVSSKKMPVDQETLGRIMPRSNLFSANRSYFSWLMGKKEYTLDARVKGGERHMIMSGEYDKVLPMDILPEFLIKAIIAGDIDRMEALGIYEVAPEDFALCEFVCSSKMELQRIVRAGLDMLRAEMA